MTDPLDAKATSSQLSALAQKGYLDERALEYALAVAGYIPDRTAWQKFVNSLLLLLGAAFTVSGIFFFFAYNWADMHHFLKFGLIQAAIVGAVAVAWQQGLDRLPGKIALLMAAMLVGALFAVFGQVYQTGADAYTLFLNWVILISGWVIIGAFPVLWLAWLILLNLTWGFYWFQVLDPEQWTPALMLETFFLLNALALLGSEFAGRWLKSWQNIRWIPRLVATFTAIFLTIPMLIFILDIGLLGDDRFLGLAPVLYVIGIGLAILTYYKIVPDLFILALCALSIIVVNTSAVGRFLIIDCLTSIIISVVIILQAWIAVSLLRRANARWERQV